MTGKALRKLYVKGDYAVRPLVEAILKREELGSTGIGRGVAVPHTKHPSIDKLIRDRGWGVAGDPYVLVAGEPIGTAGVTNLVSLRSLGGERRG